MSIKHKALLNISRKYNFEFHEFHPLGRGAFSTVFKAKSIKDGNTYAIKKIPFKHEEEAETLKEIEILRTLKSDFVVSYIDSWIETNYYVGTFDIDNRVPGVSSGNLLYSDYKPRLLHIQMELCSITLTKFIDQIAKTSRNTITHNGYRKSCEIFVQLLECVQYLHAHEPPIIHRDLKPENIMLRKETNGLKVKLTDFGLSTYHNYIEQSHTKYTGTRGYRAPEVENRRQYDTKADIYSLGIIMENLFNFNHHRSSELNEIVAEIQPKYENAKKISLTCVSYEPKLRPDCRRILSEQHLWNDRNNEQLTKYLLKIYSQNLSVNINSEVLSNCKSIVIIEEIEEKAIYVTKDRHVFALRVSEHIDNIIQKPHNINEMFSDEIQNIVCGFYHVLCLTNDMRIYSFGHNDYGQLGNGTYISANKPSIIQAFNNKRMIDIKCGAYHSLALSESGRVYVWGSGEYGQIGNGFNNNENTPFEIDSLNSEQIDSIACGFNHCLALSKSGKLYGWGENLYGQLGIGSNGNQSKPKIVKFPAQTALKICCGSSHSLVLTKNHFIYAFGNNACGQLGIGSKKNQNRPKKIKTSIKFVDIEIAFCHSLSVGLSVDKKFYVWGKCRDRIVCTPQQTTFNSFHETFIYSCDHRLFPPIYREKSFFTSTFINKLNELNAFKNLDQKMIANLLTLSLVRIKESKAILVTSDDIVYTFRLNQSIENLPQKSVIVNELSNKRIKTIVCGYNHVLCLTENNEVYSFGDNYSGQLGNGSRVNNYKPRIIIELNDKHIIDISCGFYHCLALSKSGKVFAWGYGYNGQIGTGFTYYQLTPTEIKSLFSVKITALSCGAHHCLALSSSGKLYGWGDNRFGQLSLQRSCTKGIHILPIMIKTKKVIIKISCGHSHNLLLTNDHMIYSFGRNDFGQLGIGNTIAQNEITKIEITIKFIDIYTTFCDHISAGLSQSGKYYIWGKCGGNMFETPIETPIETGLTSFDEIFAKYSRFKFSAKQIKLPYNRQ